MTDWPPSRSIGIGGQAAAADPARTVKSIAALTRAWYIWIQQCSLSSNTCRQK